MSNDKSLEDYVEEFQKKIVNVSNDQIFKELGNYRDEFEVFYKKVENSSRRIIANLIKNNDWHSLDQEEVLQNFVLKRLPTAIKDFDREKKCQFTTYIYRLLKYQCLDDLRKVEPRVKEELPYDFTELSSLPLTAFFKLSAESIDRKLAFVEFLKGFFMILNNVNTAIPKIMTYHSWELIDQIFRYEDADKLLEKWGCGTEKMAADAAENAYTASLELEIIENFMVGIIHRIGKGDIKDRIFVGPRKINARDNRERNEWVRQVKDHLSKSRNIAAIEKLKMELIECIN